MASILFYAGPEDNADLRSKVESLGLRIYSGGFVEPGVLPEVGPETYHGNISFQSPYELHPYPGQDQNFPYRISTVTDPLISWLPSYTVEHESDHYIVHGRLCWDFDDISRMEEAKTGKLYFGQLSRWIRKNWPSPSKGGVCRGPQAQKLIQFKSYIPTGLPPDVKIEYVKV